jgi:hypothetical protein
MFQIDLRSGPRGIRSQSERSIPWQIVRLLVEGLPNRIETLFAKIIALLIYSKALLKW